MLPGARRRLVTSSRENVCKRIMDRNMKSYERSTPGAALGVIAVAMAAITLGVFVVLPAEFDSVSADPNAQAAAQAATKEAIGVATRPARIEVPEVVSREEEVQ